MASEREGAGRRPRSSRAHGREPAVGRRSRPGVRHARSVHPDDGAAAARAARRPAATCRATSTSRSTRRTARSSCSPSTPNVVYVPYYNPFVVYGTWWWPAYRPVYWRPWVARPVYVTRAWYPAARLASGAGAHRAGRTLRSARHRDAVSPGRPRPSAGRSSPARRALSHPAVVQRPMGYTHFRGAPEVHAQPRMQAPIQHRRAYAAQRTGAAAQRAGAAASRARRAQLRRLARPPAPLK